MSIKQLYDLQCLEQNIAADEQALAKARAQLGESQALKQARDNLTRASKNLAIIRDEQKTTEQAIVDLSAKMTVANESLYSGRIQNPKELQNLQRELASWQTQRNPLEEKELALMEKMEQAGKTERMRLEELAAAEAQWQVEQAALVDKIKLSEEAIEVIKHRRLDAISQIPTGDLAPYTQLRKTHGWAVARLNQGTCGHCRLGLSTATLQRARAGQMVNCPSCGRLLFYE